MLWLDYFSVVHCFRFLIYECFWISDGFELVRGGNGIIGVLLPMAVICARSKYTPNLQQLVVSWTLMKSQPPGIGKVT